MFRKNYFTFLFTVALFLAAASFASAQSYPVIGRVMVKKADNTTVGAEGALVEVFREDSKLKLPSTKTDKKGNFSFAGLLAGHKYILSVSGPGISPLIYPNVPAGAKDFIITVSEGDGKRFTEEEVKQTLKGQTGNLTNANTEPTEEEKKAAAERQKQIDEFNAKKVKADKSFEIVNAALKEGSAAFEAKNYDLAISKFEEAANANPDFAGSAPVSLNNKASALLRRGTDTYNKSVKGDENTKTAAREAAKKDYDDAIAASDRAIAILKTATTTDPNIQKNYAGQKLFALTNRKEGYRLLSKTGVDRTKGKEALTAYEEYLAVEADPKLKSAAQYELAQTLQDSNEFELSVIEFEKIIAAEPNNVDALAGIGLSLVNVGYMNMESDAAKGKAQLQQGANYLQKFVDIAPDTHPYKDEAKTVILTLKSQQNLTPQKVTTTKKKQ
jgi:tetratricopeptide (TPR) repeat protein